MSRTRICCVCLAALFAPAALIVVGAPAGGTVHANQQPGKGDQPKNRKPRAQNPPAAPKKEAKPPADPNLLSLELKALRILRALEATPHQISEIARAGKTTAGSGGKREAGKASDAYVEAMVQMRRALVANDEDAVEKLRTQFDELEEKSPPDLDDGVEITDGAQIEAVRLLNIFSPQQVAAYALSLNDDFPDPVHLIQEALQEGHSLKKEEWETARSKVAEEVGWLVYGLQGEKATKLEEQVSAFLDQKHLEEVKPGARDPEIRKLVGSPGPVVVLTNVMQHALAELLSNPQVGKAANDCLPHGGPRPSPGSAAKPAAAAPPAPQPEAKRPRRQESKSADTAVKRVQLEDVVKAPDAYEGQQLQFDNVTVTGTAQGKAPVNLWLAVKTASGTVVNASRDQKLTILIPVAKAPASIKEMKSGDGGGVTVTLICTIQHDRAKHWNARVLSVHEKK